VKLDKLMFTLYLDVFGSNAFLALKIIDFDDVSLTKSYSFLHVKQDGCIINMMEDKNVIMFSIDIIM